MCLHRSFSQRSFPERWAFTPLFQGSGEVSGGPQVFANEMLPLRKSRFTKAQIGFILGRRSLETTLWGDASQNLVCHVAQEAEGELSSLFAAQLMIQTGHPQVVKDVKPLMK